MKRNLASDIFVMLRRIFFTPMGVLLYRQWCLVNKTSWIMKVLVKYYPATNWWIKLMNGKSAALLPRVK